MEPGAGLKCEVYSLDAQRVIVVVEGVSLDTAIDAALPEVVARVREAHPSVVVHRSRMWSEWTAESDARVRDHTKAVAAALHPAATVTDESAGWYIFTIPGHEDAIAYVGRGGLWEVQEDAAGTSYVSDLPFGSEPEGVATWIRSALAQPASPRG